MTKKMDPELFNNLKTVTSMAIAKLQDPNTFCTAQSQGGDVPGQIGLEGGERGPASTEKPKLSELLKQAQEAHKERDRILKEMEESNNY